MKGTTTQLYFSNLIDVVEKKYSFRPDLKTQYVSLYTYAFLLLLTDNKESKQWIEKNSVRY